MALGAAQGLDLLAAAAREEEPREHLRSGQHGYAVRDDDAFVAAAVQLGTDDALRRRLGENACEAVRSLRPEQVATDFDNLLAGLAAQRRPHENVATA